MKKNNDLNLNFSYNQEMMILVISLELKDKGRFMCFATLSNYIKSFIHWFSQISFNQIIYSNTQQV